MGFCWALAAILTTTGAIQTKIDLKYEPFPLKQFVGGAPLAPSQVGAKVPAGFSVKTESYARFGEGRVLIVLGSFRGKPAALVEPDGKSDLRRVKPLAQQKGDGGFTYYGPFDLKSRQAVVRCRIVNMPEPDSEKMLLSPCGHWVGSGVVLGRAVQIIFTDFGCDGTADQDDLLEIVWGGTWHGAQYKVGLGYGKSFATLLVNPDGTSIQVTTVNPPSTEVRLPADEVAGSAFGSGLAWLLASENGVLHVPTDASLSSVEATRLRDGKKWKVRLAPDYGDKDRVHPVQTIPNDIRIDPLKGELTQTDIDGKHGFAFTLHTPDGLKVTGFTVDGKDPLAPVLELLNADGSIAASLDFALG